MREGGRYPDAWHYMHMKDPTSMSPGSIMPSYSWLLTNQLNLLTTPAKIRTLRSLGVPYPAGYELTASQDLTAQADQISNNLRNGNIDCQSDREIIALIAYLQRLGTDIKPKANPSTPISEGAPK